MSVLQKLKSALPIEEDDSIESRTFECQECGTEFETTKPPERAMCPDCMEHNAQPIE